MKLAASRADDPILAWVKIVSGAESILSHRILPLLMKSIAYMSEIFSWYVYAHTFVDSNYVAQKIKRIHL